MARFTIGIVKRGQNPHVACFEDFAEALRDALRELGHELCPTDRPGRLIMFAANNLIDAEKRIPKDAILYNAEQLNALEDPRLFLEQHEQFKNHVVWDYSRRNIDELKKLGFTRAVWCPVGYMPSMTKISSVDEDIDVLHYGSLGNRRREVLDALTAEGIKVVHMFGVYGAERDKAIARAKIVLNLHYYPRPVFEIFRCSHLFANSKCVVTEDGSEDQDLEDLASRAAVLVPRRQIVSACKALLENEDKRRSIAEKGFREFRALDLAATVRTALEQSVI